MIEWVFNKKLHQNPELLKIFENTLHPLFRKYNVQLRDYYIGIWNHEYLYNYK